MACVWGRVSRGQELPRQGPSLQAGPLPSRPGTAQPASPWPPVHPCVTSGRCLHLSVPLGPVNMASKEPSGPVPGGSSADPGQLGRGGAPGAPLSCGCPLKPLPTTCPVQLPGAALATGLPVMTDAPRCYQGWGPGKSTVASQSPRPEPDMASGAEAGPAEPLPGGSRASASCLQPLRPRSPACCPSLLRVPACPLTTQAPWRAQGHPVSHLD